VTDEEAQEAIEQEKRQRLALEDWAFRRVRTWEELEEGDYDFSSWVKGASKNRLIAGALYEYARESVKLRGLLVLMDPKRRRRGWEMVRPANVNGKPPDPSEPLARAMPFPCSFRGLDQHAAERALGGFLYCLQSLAGYLAKNISFAELFESKRDELEKAFGGLDKLARVRREHRYFLPVGEAVRVATRSQIEDITTAKTLLDEKERILLGGSEVIAVQFDWGNFTDRDFGLAMRKFAKDHRPRNAACKEPQRKGQRPLEVIQSDLKALAAMRIWKRHKGDRWKRLKLVASDCRYKGCVKESLEYERRRTQGQGHCDQPMSNNAQARISEACADAVSFLQRLFPWEIEVELPKRLRQKKS
jgi:hypothetical protein